MMDVVTMNDSESGDSGVAKWEGMSNIDIEGYSVDGEGSVGIGVGYVDDAVSEDSNVSVAVPSNVAANSDAAGDVNSRNASVDSSMSDRVDATYA